MPPLRDPATIVPVASCSPDLQSSRAAVMRPSDSRRPRYLMTSVPVSFSDTATPPLRNPTTIVPIASYSPDSPPPHTAATRPSDNRHLRDPTRAVPLLSPLPHSPHNRDACRVYPLLSRLPQSPHSRDEAARSTQRCRQILFWTPCFWLSTAAARSHVATRSQFAESDIVWEDRMDFAKSVETLSRVLPAELEGEGEGEGEEEQ